ncbi:hypothetical protein S1OALGB6SA_311 [Olavius algarvensis spirochete endosymbiont]|uniref:hypothetical protein n=1 Tax=Olavius algarvensis spirochete endosymbiont TaxID=260710 RepID=UPI00052DBC4D|nr:hypothetical protein [Olavius algarvensis spirochete endosymbiont]KGM42932.1 hypothetical protein JY97_10660 [Alkalispirochaeta odontotermitis]CAD7846120.1 MAG: hypothetical protein [Olavius algarvensis spirochete endosymbiont]VDA99248.1 hypothetical protein S1OALGB6SA_311 [Olavius algarvensis spirochete endosymbiont]
MRKIFLFIVLIGGIAILVSILSDPAKKERIIRAIESSTGVDLDSIPKEAIEDTGRALGEKTGKMLKDLGDVLTDPKLRRSLEKWSKDALERLDEEQFEKLKRELEAGRDDYDIILERYLGKTGDS